MAPCRPGARPTIRRRASIGPKEGTGALCQPGSFARHACRKAASRGHSGQSRAGCAGWSAGAGLSVGSVFEIVVAAGPLRHSAALQELRRVLTLLAGFARRSFAAVARIAADLPLQFDDVNELVGLPA